MPTARNDSFAFFENHLAGNPPVFSIFFGGLFDDNGNGADTDPEGDAFAVVALDGLSLNEYLYLPPLVVIMLPSGAEIDIDVTTGNFGFFIHDAYDWLPAGWTAVESFTYTIRDANGDESTATATFTITGIDSDDLFIGTDGRDVFNGGIGRDTLIGGAGNDELAGGLGADILTGGAGADDFNYASIKESGTASVLRDTITDFRRGSATTGDDIDLHLIDASTKKPGDQAFKFIGAEAFHKVAGELHYRHAGANVIVEGDVNGDGRADFSILVKNVQTLSSGDFIL
jgi:Ca2+-binding RTX toxin-like protein